MSEQRDGGAAFPHYFIPTADGGRHITGGMSLRDWFAGQALKAVIIASGGWEPIERSDDPEEYTPVTEIAYAIADSMLIERDRKS